MHRDIKPGNILLDQNGQPHLTDFGLARLIDTESSVTRTIEILGTPSYMAPEQAAGETGKLSKATDVYGLGAVLYQLLTSQPPFAGGTTYETIRLLRDTEPRSPRLLNPKVDRDLSTMCLKCLEKDPKRRYSSALALGEDLERWVKHEPIQARRTGILTRGKKWMRRNPTSVLLGASLIALAAGAAWIVWKSEFIRNPVVTNGVAILPFENLSTDSENAYLEQALALDPRNVELLSDTAWTYAMLRQFPTALKLYDRVLDIIPNHPPTLAAKASTYQAQGNLQEAARWLSGIDWQNPSGAGLQMKLDQCKLERNYGELIRLAQAQLTQTDDQNIKVAMQIWIALTQRLAGDTAGAKFAGEAACNGLEQLYREQTDDPARAYYAAMLSNAYAAMGQKEAALEAAERSIKLFARGKDELSGPQLEENQALIQTMFGEKGRAIGTLAELLQTPYRTFVYNLASVTPALLRLDPFWDPLRSDPAFQKLCEQKQP